MINETETLDTSGVEQKQDIIEHNTIFEFISVKKFFIGAILGLLLFVSIYKFVLPNFINADIIYKIAKSSVQDGYSLDIQGLSADLTWDLALVLDAAKIDILQGQKNILHSDKITLKVPLVMLLFKKFDNMQFSSDSLNAHLERDNNGDLNLKKAFKFKDSATKISKFRLLIKDYNINFVDKNAPPIILDGYNLDFGNLKLYRLKTFGTIVFPDKTCAILNVNFISKKPLNKGEFILKGNVDNLNLKNIEKYLVEIYPDFTHVSGVLNGDFDIDAYGREKITNNLKLSLNANNVFVGTKKYPHYLEIADDAQIFAEGKYYNFKLNLKKFRIISGNYNFECSGSIKNINKNIKNLNLKVRTKDSNIKKLLGIVPKNAKVKYDGVNKAVKYNIDGIINSDLLIKGDSEAFKYYGSVKIKQFVTDADLSKSKSYIDLFYKRRKLTIKSSLVDAMGGNVESTGVSFMGKRPKIDFKISSQKFSLGEMQKNLIALSDILDIDVGILPKMKLDGLARVNLSIKGRGKNADVNGYLHISKANIGHNEFSKLALVENQNLEFQKRKVLFENFVSTVDLHRAVLNGFISLDDNLELNLDASNYSLPLAISIVKNSPMLLEVANALEFVDSGLGNINLKIKFTKNAFGKLESEGKLQLLNNTMLLKDFSALVTDCLGEIIFDGKKVEAKNITAKALGSPIVIVAKIDNKNLDAKISAHFLETNSVVKTILTSKALSHIAPVLTDINAVSGRLSADLYFKGNSKEDFFDRIDCQLFNNKIYLHNAIAPINIINGSFSADKNELKVNKIIFNFLNAKGNIDGIIKNFGKNPDCNLKVLISNIDTTVFNSLKNSNLEPNLKKFFNNFTDFRGNASANILIKKNITGKITFNNLGIKYLPAALPLNIKAGDMIIEDNKVILPNLQLNIGSSKFKLNGALNRNKTLNLDLKGDLSPDDVDKYLNKILLTPFNLKKTIPIKLNFKKTASNNWELLAGGILEQGNIISYKGFTIGDKASSYLMGGKVCQNNSLLKFENLGVHQLPNSMFSYFNLNNLLLHKNYFEISGWINKNSCEENLKIYARDFMDINIFNQLIGKNLSNRLFQSGRFKGDLLLRGKIDSPQITGYLDIEEAKIPAYKTIIKNLKIIFEKDYIHFENALFKIADSELTVDAIAENLIDIPYVFKEMTITSGYVDVDEIIKIFQDNSGELSEGRPLFVVKKGTMSAKKLIVNNLITDNSLVDFSFTPDWVMTLDRFSFSTAGGEVVGNSSFDFLTKRSQTYMKFKNLKANAAATTLLQMPNEIYGVLNGEARFFTKGITRSDMVKNSNGNVKFQITSGRLVRLGSLEYLLMAAEVMKSGITGLSINNICTLLAPKKTGYFNTINVNFKVKNGVLFTDDLVSRGENLSIYLAGNFDMTTNFSDFTILGRVSKSVIKILGPIGDLCINKVLNAIPGVDESVSEKFSLPGVNLSDKDHRRFVVNIEGDLYNQKSVKNFKWID